MSRAWIVAKDDRDAEDAGFGNEPGQRRTRDKAKIGSDQSAVRVTPIAYRPPASLASSALKRAVAAVREFAAAIRPVVTVASAIAAAVKEQAAATREITNSVQLVSATMPNAAAAMRQVMSIAESTDATNVSACKLAVDEVGKTAGTLPGKLAEESRCHDARGGGAAGRVGNRQRASDRREPGGSADGGSAARH
jgi:hypothetical protein